ncbi:hypothetical protein [Streptomyces sp. NPDC059063]|uniref:hypothetical protein n=1 Tax=unclassified Streptomyces TaxID=2593676 RepID=UPI0036CD1DDA
MAQQQLTALDRCMYVLMNRTEGEPLYRTAARRRAVVVVHIALTVAEVVAWLATVFGERTWTVWVMLGLLLPWCVATGVINGSTRGLLELRTRALDERQRAERDRVRARAYRIMTWLLLAVVVGTGVAGLAGVGLKVLVFQAAACVLAAHWLTPLWVAGFSVKDEPADEFDEDFAVEAAH